MQLLLDYVIMFYACDHSYIGMFYDILLLLYVGFFSIYLFHWRPDWLIEWHTKMIIVYVLIFVFSPPRSKTKSDCDIIRRIGTFKFAKVKYSNAMQLLFDIFDWLPWKLMCFCVLFCSQASRSAVNWSENKLRNETQTKTNYQVLSAKILALMSQQN
jgi:uncharacterized membrane protein YeiB